MMNKLMPIMAKALVTLVFATISVVGVNAQAFDSQILNVDLDTPAIVEDLNAENAIVDTHLNELSDYYIDSQVTEVDEVLGDVELHRLPNTTLDGEDIQLIDVFDLADTTNR